MVFYSRRRKDVAGEEGAIVSDRPMGEKNLGGNNQTPLTQEILNELALLIVRDIRAWSVCHGYQNVPPAEFLRQVYHIVDAIDSTRWNAE